jgi:hypothetical protein
VIYLRLIGISGAYYCDIEENGENVLIKCSDIAFNSTALLVNKKRFKEDLEKFLKTI